MNNDLPDDDDHESYQFPAHPEEKSPCPKCKKLLPRGAVLCNHCGFNQDTGTTLQRVHEKVDKQWDPGLAFRVRLGIFLAVQGLALMATVVVALADGAVLSLVFSWVIGAALLAYLLGTYPRLNLTRAKKGRVRITRTWHICFIPLVPADIPWRGHETVITAQSHATGFFDWLPVLFLAPFCVIPAVLWWLYVIRPDQFDVALTKNHGSSTLLLFRCHSETLAEDIAATTRKVTGLG